mmetsp:Transcript_9055/g.25942  ORF Transcript_9055/g.25942 Transcript_9055/m.25942 type:complete len:200 (-) Transcript_9055:74-673(-)
MWITKSNQTNTVYQIAGCVSTFTLSHDFTDGGKDGIHHVVSRSAVRFERFGKQIQQQFRIGIRVDMSLLADHVVVQLIGVGEVAVVRNADAVRVVGVQGLGLGAGAGARRGVSHVADAHVPAQLEHVVLLEDVPHQAVVLSEMQPEALCRDHAGSILAPVLQDREAVEQQLVDVGLLVGEEQTQNSAHLGCRRRLSAVF